MTKQLATVPEAIEDYKAGKFVIIVDDEDRENEGDLVIAAEHITPEAVNFMATHGRGLICIAMTGQMLDRLHIPLMVPQANNRSGFGTGFTISVEATIGVTTGISAFDRARTIQTLIDPRSTPNDIAMPGHIFPLRAREGGVLERRGQTEASVDLAKLAGLTPAGVICEVMSNNGEMARLPELLEFAERHHIKIVSVEAIANYRYLSANGQCSTKYITTQHAVTKIASSRLPTKYGEFVATIYRDMQGKEHMALTMGDLTNETPLVRLHSECLTGDALGSLRCDCGEQLQSALARVAEEGNGALLYLRQEGRGIGLGNKIKAYALQDEGLDTIEANHQLGFPADARDYRIAVSMLNDLDITELRLLTNNPDKQDALQSRGIDVVERVPHEIKPHSENWSYLQTKASKMGHLLNLSVTETN
ncbi:MAG: 3,4-dihydroxy-2-butanone-4-phosphate synthase [Anaerolineae bacterium]